MGSNPVSRQIKSAVASVGLAGLMACFGLPQEAGATGAEMKWAYNYLEPCSKGSPNRPVCVRFIDGFLRGAKVQAEYSNTRLPYCLPETTGPEQVADAYYAFMENYTHFQYLEAGGLLHIVLGDKWPCVQS
ncbi:Rap1a/Tai family immunity protein [Microvirga tunisiensis]|jgi:hypothetical protein|uniref:Rap1a/Tai family immunity protein n=2 Tax=Microvirga tunisiensis TaxID=2108360 RepID=UPI003CC7C9C4